MSYKSNFGETSELMNFGELDKRLDLCILQLCQMSRSYLPAIRKRFNVRFTNYIISKNN